MKAKDLKESCSTCEGSKHISGTLEFMSGEYKGLSISSDCVTCHGKTIRKVPKCKSCKNSGLIKQQVTEILSSPKGAYDGLRMKFQNKGHENLKGKSGNLIIEFKVEDQKNFEIQDKDIIVHTDISLAQAVLGGKIEVDLPTGKRALQIKSG